MSFTIKVPGGPSTLIDRTVFEPVRVLLVHIYIASLESTPTLNNHDHEGMMEDEG